MSTPSPDESLRRHGLISGLPVSSATKGSSEPCSHSIRRSADGRRMFQGAVAWIWRLMLDEDGHYVCAVAL